MLDIKFIKNNLEKVKQGISAKQNSAELIDELLKKHDEWRKTLQEFEKLRQKRNEIAKMGKFSEEGKELKEQLKKAEIENENALKAYKEMEVKIPNLPLDTVPVGDPSKFEIIKKYGEPKKFGFSPKDHLELGESLDIIDVQRAAKVSGTRFAYLKNEGALLEFALIQFVMERLYKEGFIPIIPPMLIKYEITAGLGYWTRENQNNYYLVSDYEDLDPDPDSIGIEEGKGKENPLYLVGTAEHSIAPMHKDEVLQSRILPLRYVGFSSAFRREAGSYGKDTRGILRVHQFDKIEMVAFVKPEEDEIERGKMLSLSENFMQDLELPYRLVKLASEDLSFPAAETIDIETWMPSQNKYRETHSISTTTDFQARRLNIKYQDGSDKKFVHILNGTAFAIGRTIIAILENYQEEDGSIQIPEVLKKYIGFDKISKKSSK